MTRLCWWLADAVSQTLEADERMAARGDLDELGTSGGRALLEMLGLVARRQLDCWTGWRPWLALVSVAVPLGVSISHVSRHWAEGSAAYAWVYLAGGAAGSLSSTVWRSGTYDPVAYIWWLSLNVVTLVGWAWTGGWVLARMARGSIWTIGPMFYLLLVLGACWSVSIGDLGGLPLSSSTMYGVLLPALLRVVPVILPAVWGMAQGVRSTLPPRAATIMMALVIVILTLRAVSSLEVALTGAWWLSELDRGGWASGAVLIVTTVWPVTYLAGLSLMRCGANGA